jgi:threonine dehydrogenase-like Zn-dependent dehydrogenase
MRHAHTMQALVFDKQIKYHRDYPDLAPRAGASIVRVSLAGICGTDLEISRGYLAFRGVPGHEFVGRVVETSNPDLRGKRVVGEINAGCGRCAACLADLTRHCPNRTVLGILGRDGSFAEFLTLPDENLLPVPDSIPDDAAVFTEPLAAAFEIFEQIHIGRNQSILVLGDGRLGAMVALALNSRSYEPLVVGHHPEKLERLSALGIKTTETAPQDKFDVVVDCTGKGEGFRTALERVAPRGTIILKSTAAAGAELNLAPVVINEITVLGSRCGRFAPALEALAVDRIDPRPLIDGIFSLSDGIDAIGAAANPSNFKILLKPA